MLPGLPGSRIYIESTNTPVFGHDSYSVDRSPGFFSGLSAHHFAAGSFPHHFYCIIERILRIARLSERRIQDTQRQRQKYADYCSLKKSGNHHRIQPTAPA